MEGSGQRPDPWLPTGTWGAPRYRGRLPSSGVLSQRPTCPRCPHAEVDRDFVFRVIWRWFFFCGVSPCEIFFLVVNFTRGYFSH